MEWLLDHLQFVIAVVVIAIYVLSNMRRHAGGQRDAGHDETGGGAPPPAGDADEFERTRRIQEEIRRRILARQRGESVPAQPPPLPVGQEEEEVEEPEWLEEGPRPQPARPPPRATAFPAAPPEPVAAAARSMDAATAGILEQQRLLAQQLEALRAARALGTMAVPPLPANAYTIAGAAASAGGMGIRRAVRKDLAGRGGLRRAVILREILGEAPGLKRGPLQLPRR